MFYFFSLIAFNLLFAVLFFNNNIKDKISDLILFNGRNGFLFQNNNLSDLLNKFDEFKKLDEDELNKKKLFAKKEIKMFTQFAHFKSLIEKLINYETCYLYMYL